MTKAIEEIKEQRKEEEGENVQNVETSQIKKRIVLSTVLLIGFIGVIAMGRSVLIGFIILLTILVFYELLKVLLKKKDKKTSTPNRKHKNKTEERTEERTENTQQEKQNILPVSFFWLCFVSISLLRYGSMVCPGKVFLIKQIFIPLQFVWIAWFISLLKGKSYKMKIFHLSIVIVSTVGLIECAESAINNVNRGVFWFVLPCVLVGINDTFAYLVGKAIGHTPLIELSPKKTIEGFIGGGFFTIILSIPLSSLIRYITAESINISYTDSIILGVIASFVAPIGGVIASGYKRAFKVKNFSRLIPGHGGVSDRIDCQLIMQLITNLYLISIVRKPTVQRFFDEISRSLTPEESLNLVNLLLENYRERKRNEIF